MATEMQASQSWLEMVAAHARPGLRAVMLDDGRAWTYDELLSRAGGAAAWLDAAQAEPGVPIPAFVPAGPAAFALLLAGAMSGRPLAPLSPRFTVAELTACLARLPAGPIITDVANRPVVATVAEHAGRSLLVLPPELPVKGRALDIDAAPDAIMAVVHTSGTTGLPKAVYQRQGPLGLRVPQSADPIELAEGSVYATASAFHHQAGAGMFLVALGAGATLVPVPHFAVESWAALEDLGPTHATVVPALLETLLAAGVLRLPSLKWIQYGSSPLHPDTARRLLMDFPNVRLVQQLGQTEGSPITTLYHQDHLDAVAGPLHRLKSVGRPVPRSELRVESADADGIGEICSRAAHYFFPDPDGWLRTGDLGRQDEDGYVYLVGRRNDAINRGGETVYPVEVEQAIAGHPEVLEVAVAGRPDRRLGQVPHAFVVPVHPERPPPPAELMAFTRERLAGYKVPRHWHMVESLPRNPSGKVLRRRLVDGR